MNVRTKIINNLGINKIAIIDQDEQYTYTDFGKRVRSCYEYLINNNIKRVLFQLPQGIDSYVIVIAAYLARSTFCAVHMDHPQNRLNKYIEAFSPQLIIINDISNIYQKENESNCKQYLVSKNYFEKELDNNIAYVLFTSGSTGGPKGVAIERQSLDSFLEAIIPLWGIEKEDIFGQYSSMGFDLSIADVFCSIFAGATIIPIKTKGQKLLPGQVIRSKGITFWHSVPSVIDLIERSNMGKNLYLKSLKKVSFCGEKLFKSQLDFLFDVNPDLVVFNTYGPTETTVFCTLLELNRSNYHMYCDNTVSIGKPLYEQIKLIVNHEKNDNKGVGELVIEGDNVSLGYINADGNDSFFYDSDNKLRGYITGDYVYTKDDNLYFYGRKDTQIKHLGNRIDLSEIDACIRDAGLQSITSLKNGRIITFVVGGDINIKDLMDYLSDNLPAYSLPQKVIAVQRFPYVPSGKIDLNKLLKEV